MKRKIWTSTEIEMLKRNYSKTPTKELAAKLHITIDKVYYKANALGLQKDKQFIKDEMSKIQSAAVAAGTHKGGFHKGHIPANKGQKMSEATRAKIAHTWFPTGNLPHNHKPIGSQRITKDGYIKIKIKEPRTWDLLHRHNWRKLFGKIPASHALVFRNKNKTDCRVENLQLIKRSTLMQRNTIQRFPEEIKSTIRLLSKFKKKIKNHEQ